MDEEKKIEGRVTAWGLRLAVPAGVIKGIGLALQDEVVWTMEEVGGKKVAVLSKKEQGSEPIVDWVERQTKKGAEDK